MRDDRMTTATVSEHPIPQSEAEVVDAVRTAHDERVPLRIVGRGGWLRAGRPVEAQRTLDVSKVNGIVEYVPGDLTMTARAGTTLAEIADATAVHRQWLPLDPFGDLNGTLGATLATASAGPLGGSIGLPRDVTVGVSFVTGSGEIVRGGGRVVKNVAGFDLVRLTIGAWGTLGVITEATVRLRARPEADETFVLALPDERDALATLLSTIRVAAVEPLAAELLSPVCANGVGLGNQAVMLVRLAGNTTGVHHQRATLAKLAPCEPVSSDVWLKLRQSDPTGGVVVRVSRRPSELARLWSIALTSPDVDAHATLARGTVRLRLTSDHLLDAFDPEDRRVFEEGSRLPAPTNAISERMRDAFDPARILNRGILGENTR
ncbi:MAG TPA: FAD-binding protein [Gemmatimonadaceae bacterium]